MVTTIPFASESDAELAYASILAVKAHLIRFPLRYSKSQVERVVGYLNAIASVLLEVGEPLTRVSGALPWPKHRWNCRP